MTKTCKRVLGLLLAAALVAPPADAGLLGKMRELLDQSGTVMTNFNENMWGDSGLGATAINSVKGAAKGEKKVLDVFTDITAAQDKANAAAYTDVKAVLKTVWEIITWLPRKLNELFKKALGKVNDFMGKLAAMNQGATVKDRFNNLVGGGGGGGGGAAAVAPADLGGGGDDIGDFDAALADAASVDAEDAPMAPRASKSLPSIDGSFGEMLDHSREGLEGDRKKAATARIRKLYLSALDLAFGKDSSTGAKQLFEEAPSVFRGAPKGMQRAVESLADKHGSKLSKAFAKGTGRLSKSMQVHAQ
jgi:hypothetical protein